MVEHVFVGESLIISACYVVFAFLLWLQAPKGAIFSKAGRAIAALMAVFLLCMMAGYALDVIAPHAEKLSLYLHRALAGVSVFLVLSNSPGAIAKVLTDDRR